MYLSSPTSPITRITLCLKFSINAVKFSFIVLCYVLLSHFYENLTGGDLSILAYAISFPFDLSLTDYSSSRTEHNLRCLLRCHILAHSPEIFVYWRYLQGLLADNVHMYSLCILALALCRAVCSTLL